MKKPQLLRQTLLKNNQFLIEHPDRLHTFIDAGKIISTTAKSFSFEYKYTLNIVITDYSDPIDSIMVPLVAWLYFYQQEAWGNGELREDALTYEVDHHNNNAFDISINIKLTERIITREGKSGLEIKHCDDLIPEEFRPTWANKIWHLKN